jgi:hypothetical protein
MRNEVGDALDALLPQLMLRGLGKCPITGSPLGTPDTYGEGRLYL